MQGRRVHPNADGVFPYAELQPGDFFLWDGAWYAEAPNGLLCGLRKHQVTEHEDGTITVSPSILVSNGAGGQRWHGFLQRGVWSEC